MSRVDDYLALIDDPDAPALELGHPADGPLLGLLVHLAYSDGRVQEDEVALLALVRPDLNRDELLNWAGEESLTPFDMSTLREIAATNTGRRNILRFAARMVCLDGDVAEEEVWSLQQLAVVLGLPDDAPEGVVNEIVARGGEISRDRVAQSLRNMLWRELIPQRDDLGEALAGLAPSDTDPVCVITLDDEEVAGLFYEGLAAHFDDGPAWIAFDDVDSYTRVPVPGAAFHLHTRDGRHLSMSNPRLRDLGALFDFIYGRTSPEPPELQ